MPQRKIVIRLGTNSLEFNSFSFKNNHQQQQQQANKSFKSSFVAASTVAAVPRYPNSDSSSESDKDDDDLREDELVAQRLRRSLETAFVAPPHTSESSNTHVSDKSEIQEPSQQPLMSQSSDDDEFDLYERQQHHSYFEEMHENASVVATTENDEMSDEHDNNNNYYYDDDTNVDNDDYDYFGVDADLEDFAERAERSFLNGKRDFTYRRSTNQNREERYRKNHWIKALDQRKEEERRSFRLFQVNRSKLNSQTEWVIHQSRAVTSNAKYDEDRDLQRALQISARDYATQAARHVTALSARQLAELMSRELTPEDYELLLALDESVAKKTVDEKKIATFEQIPFDAATMAATSDICMICMTDFQQSEQCTRLPCQHFFHATCIERWLKEFSCCCPIDKTKFD